MSDLIDRQAVINKINERQRKLVYCFGFENDLAKIMNIAKSIIIAIPSAQPEDVARDIATIIENEKDMRVMLSQRWIPCSERLPDMHDEVLVTARGEVSIAWLYVDGKWRSNDMPQPMLRDIIAWMPLPEPYKGEQE